MKKESLKMFLLILTVTLILTNEKSSAQMFWNQACSFAGNSSSYISRGSATGLDITGSFTIELWINPATPSSTQTILQKREGNNAVGYGLYLHNGKVSIRTNANTRLTGKTVLPVNTWTHVAGRYVAGTDLFTVIINGFVDTSVAVAGADPVSSSDSLFIGKGFNAPFHGQMDEIRIWKTPLNNITLATQSKTSLGTNTGIYHDLVMSLTFQDSDADGDNFTLNDQSGNSYNFFNRGVTAVDLSDRPSRTININDCIELSGNNQYLAGPDAGAVTPFVFVTMEAWIFPRSVDLHNIIIHKGSDDGASIDYNLSLVNGRLFAAAGDLATLYSDDVIPLNQWSHVAYTFNGIDGSNTFYLNGRVIDSGTGNTGLINNSNDSFYVGGTMAMTDFDGYIDEVRVKALAKSHDEINKYLFRSIDESNDLSGVEAVYNFDGYTESNVGVPGRLYFRNQGRFSHSGMTGNAPLSPLNRADDLNFQEGFYLKTSDRRIPAAGASGLMNTDTLNISYNETINDVNVFVALNHTSEVNLSITLFSPNGESVNFYNSHLLGSSADNMVTIFDDQADSLINNGVYVSFAPVVKPLANLNSAFSGYNSSGKWRLVINDLNPNDTGRLYGWGIQINNRTFSVPVLSSTSLIQGFYDSSTNIMARDTMRYYIRNFASPYNIVDSAKRYLQYTGFEMALLNNVLTGTPYYLQLKHRNSIETWSANPIMFDPLTSQAEYNFANSVSQAFGNNMIEADASPSRYAIYSGDVNQDGSVDLTDGSLIDNDAYNFTSGYVNSDVNGDGFTDLADYSIADNNAFEFVSKVTP